MKILNPTDAEIVKAVLAWVRPSMLREPAEHHVLTSRFERQQRAEARLWRLAVDAYKRRVILGRGRADGRTKP